MALKSAWKVVKSAELKKLLGHSKMKEWSIYNKFQLCNPDPKAYDPKAYFSVRYAILSPDRFREKKEFTDRAKKVY